MNKPRGRALQCAFTLIELMVVIAIAGILILLAAPSFKNFIEMQRVRSVNSQVVTDLQFARNEAASRGLHTYIAFKENESMTCYTLYLSPSSLNDCDCRRGLGQACTRLGQQELRTVQYPLSGGVKAQVPSTQVETRLKFDYITGALWNARSDIESTPIPSFDIEVSIDRQRMLRTRLNGAGRIEVCAPSGSIVQEQAC